MLKWYEIKALATEAEAFSVKTEAKTKTFSLEAKARPRHLKFQPRQDRAKALLHLEMASRRPRDRDRDIKTEATSLHLTELMIWIVADWTDMITKCLLDAYACQSTFQLVLWYLT